MQAIKAIVREVTIFLALTAVITAVTFAVSGETYVSWSPDEKLIQFGNHTIEIDRNMFKNLQLSQRGHVSGRK